MVDGEAGSLTETHDPERRGHGPPPRRQQGAADQHEHVTPDRLGEVASEGPHPALQHRGTHARRHGTPPPPEAQGAGTRQEAREGGARGRLPGRDAHPHRGLSDRKSTRLNSSHANISYAVFCLKKKTTTPLITKYIAH